jgi:hypothetical protein
MNCEIHGDHCGPDCPWCTKDMYSMTWQCDMCGKFTSWNTIDNHQECAADRYTQEIRELRDWSYGL